MHTYLTLYRKKGKLLRDRDCQRNVIACTKIPAVKKKGGGELNYPLKHIPY